MTRLKRIRLLNTTVIITVLTLFYGFEASSLHKVESKPDKFTQQIDNFEHNNTYILNTNTPISDIKPSQKSTIQTTTNTNSHNQYIIILLGIGLVIMVLIFTEIVARLA